MINILHWLDEHGAPVPALRKRVLRIARLIEYGGPLELGHARATLVECTRRVERRPCEGLLWVVKKDAGTIEAFCEMCQASTDETRGANRRQSASDGAAKTRVLAGRLGLPATHTVRHEINVLR